MGKFDSITMRVPTLQCILCKGLVACSVKDTQRLLDHLVFEHGVSSDYDYILAGCLMTQAEREVIADVIQERESEKSLKKNLLESTEDSEEDPFPFLNNLIID